MTILDPTSAVSLRTSGKISLGFTTLFLVGSILLGLSTYSLAKRDSPMGAYTGVMTFILSVATGLSTCKSVLLFREARKVEASQKG